MFYWNAYSSPNKLNIYTCADRGTRVYLGLSMQPLFWWETNLEEIEMSELKISFIYIRYLAKHFGYLMTKSRRLSLMLVVCV